ncbi:MAG TPA: ribonuclease E inhibitor RraB [Rhizomicrobium sp.]|jgi:hypothetical protein|nr:ribonuclease E inhibitor RraB [Rhizomicrobium sp.]
MQWPQDADGDVFRRLESQGFDFTKRYTIDFQVDFECWPPPAEAAALLREIYPNVATVEPNADAAGYLEFSVSAPLTYELVTTIQRTVTGALSALGGVCNSWGVLH